jgi:hypothetical protein
MSLLHPVGVDIPPSKSSVLVYAFCAHCRYEESAKKFEIGVISNEMIED